MNWKQPKTAPKDIFVLVRFGTKSGGNMGYEIAVLNKGVWFDRSGYRVDGCGFEVTGWVLLPPLD